MSIICEHVHSEHVHRIFFNFELLWQRSKCAGSAIDQLSLVIPVFLILDMHVRNFVLFSRLTGKHATQNLKNLRNSCLWTC